MVLEDENLEVLVTCKSMTKLALTIWGKRPKQSRGKLLLEALRKAKLGRVEITLDDYEQRFFIRFAIKDNDCLGLTPLGMGVLAYDLEGNIEDDDSEDDDSEDDDSEDDDSEDDSKVATKKKAAAKKAPSAAPTSSAAAKAAKAVTKKAVTKKAVTKKAAAKKATSSSSKTINVDSDSESGYESSSSEDEWMPAKYQRVTAKRKGFSSLSDSEDDEVPLPKKRGQGKSFQGKTVAHFRSEEEYTGEDSSSDESDS